MGICTTTSATSCVIDGDTFVLNGQRIRIANIDTPEIRHAKCDAERRLAIVARARLAALLEGWGGGHGSRKPIGSPSRV